MDGRAGSFSGRLRLCKIDIDSLVGRHAPTVRGMCFTNVNGIKVGSVFEPGIQFVDDPRLGSIGASGEAAEHEHHGPLPERIGQRDIAGAVVNRQREIRGDISHLRAGPANRPQASRRANSCSQG